MKGSGNGWTVRERARRLEFRQASRSGQRCDWIVPESSILGSVDCKLMISKHDMMATMDNI